MAEYQYRVITPAGKEKKGTIEARLPEQAEALLKADGNIVLSIEEASILNKDIHISIGTPIKPRAYSIFCRQFVSILEAGVSIMKALEMLTEQTENKHLRKGIAGVKEDVGKGESLAMAMRKRGKVFPSMLCNMVEAGEASGDLETAFSRMAIQFEKEAQLKSSVRSAMIYPIALIIVMIGVLIAMLVFVIPNFMGMFADLDQGLPPATQLVVNMSNFFMAKWPVILIVVAVIIGALKYYAETAGGKFFFGNIKLKIPVFGKVQIKSNCAKFARTLSTLLAAGVPMIEAIDITARSMDNVLYKRTLMDAKDQVRRGVPLSRPLASSGLFPPMVIHMLSIGEETGNIEEMLENLANYYEEDVQVSTQRMMALMEPMIIVVMAVVVGTMVIAIIQPMFVLYESIG